MKFFKKNNYKGEEVPTLPAGYGGIKRTSTFLNPSIHAPFPVVLEDRVPGGKVSAEEMNEGEQTPPAFALELVEDGVDNLHKVEFRNKSKQLQYY